MKTSRKELKLRARRALLGNYPCAVGALVLTGAAGFAAMLIGEVWALLTGAVAGGAWGTEKAMVAIIAAIGIWIATYLIGLLMMIPGWMRMYLDICGGKRARLGTIFWGFRNHGGKFFGIALVLVLGYGMLTVPVVTLIWAAITTGSYEFAALFLEGYSILIAVFGMYISLTYGLLYLILAEDPEKSVLQALEESRWLMKGNRGRLFVLFVSFLGWIVMAYLTLGIGLLWLTPYLGCTVCCFYLDIKKKR